MALVPLGVVLASTGALDFVVADFVIPVVLAELVEVSSLVIAACFVAPEVVVAAGVASTTGETAVIGSGSGLLIMPATNVSISSVLPL